MNQIETPGGLMALALYFDLVQVPAAVLRESGGKFTPDYVLKTGVK